MKIESEAFHPPSEVISFIEDCTKGIHPDIPELRKWHNTYVVNHKARVAFDFNLVRKNVLPNSRILEVGSIPLLLTAAFARSQFAVTGVDIAPGRYRSSIERLGVPILQCDIENSELPIESNSYDAVIFFELFEHLRINLIFTMQEVYRVLKPDGSLFLSSPNLRSFEGLKNFLFHNHSYSCCGDIYAEYEKLETLGHMGHVREYTSTEVIEFLKKIGFTIIQLIYRGRYYSKTAQLAIRLFPTLRPFITYVAKKPG